MYSRYVVQNSCCRASKIKQPTASPWETGIWCVRRSTHQIYEMNWINKNKRRAWIEYFSSRSINTGSVLFQRAVSMFMLSKLIWNESSLVSVDWLALRSARSSRSEVLIELGYFTKCDFLISHTECLEGECLILSATELKATDQIR